TDPVVLATHPAASSSSRSFSRRQSPCRSRLHPDKSPRDRYCVRPVVLACWRVYGLTTPLVRPRAAPTNAPTERRDSTSRASRELRWGGYARGRGVHGGRGRGAPRPPRRRTRTST